VKLKDHMKKQLKDLRFRREYELLGMEYEIIRQGVLAKQQRGRKAYEKKRGVNR